MSFDQMHKTWVLLLINHNKSYDYFDNRVILEDRSLTTVCWSVLSRGVMDALVQTIQEFMPELLHLLIGLTQIQLKLSEY